MVETIGHQMKSSKEDGTKLQDTKANHKGDKEMMYSEFVAGTGCKDNEKNYKVFQNLEAMYMNTYMTKEEIYEYGKKLVDNSKSETEIKLEQEIKAEIESHNEEIKKYKEWIEQNEHFLSYWKEQGDKEMVAFYRNPIKGWKEEIKYHRHQITALKWVLD